jgi:VWFA-related protein
VKLLAALLAAAALAAQQQPRFPVSVERVVVDVRVIDALGAPVLGLSAGDFKVKLEGKQVAVESAVWVGNQPEQDPGIVVTPEGVAAPEPEPPGESVPRLVVFLVQKDMDPSRSRGLLQMSRKAEGLLAALGPADRVAGLLFDSHLRALFDFTDSRADARRLLRDSMISSERPVEVGEHPSLLARIDRVSMKRAASPERALQLIGEALEPLPGLKTLVFLGWGLGRFSRMGVTMTPDYDPARRALQRARCAVFALDVTDADYHSLEFGLMQVAEDTGGFYARTHIFPDAALRRMERALSGYYVLSFERPDARSGLLRLDVGLAKGKKGEVLAPSSVG